MQSWRLFAISGIGFLLISFYSLLSLPGFSHHSDDGDLKRLLDHSKHHQGLGSKDHIAEKFTQPSAGESCGDYRGVLHIREGDPRSASGTIFFLYVINHILYGQEQQLLPWVHLDPVKDVLVYDPVVHGQDARNITIHDCVVNRRGRKHPDYTCMVHANKTRGIATWKFPGKMSILDETRETEIVGNGIWDSYFEPAVDLEPCKHLPIVELGTFLVYPGLHTCAPWGVQGWPHAWTPKYLTPDYQKVSIHEWSRDKRRRASQVIKQYYKPLDWLKLEIEKTNPTPNGNCLAMHIRLTDKADGRIKLPLSEFEPYALTYAKYAPARNKIYIATDDSKIITQVENQWPILDRILYRRDTLRSESDDPIFNVYSNERHRANKEALTEIYAMARCDFLVHGFSAMTEAAIAINFEQLENHSFNVDLTEPVTLQQFEASVAKHFL